MKVVHLSCIAPPEIGGIGRVAAQEVEMLSARGIEAYQISLTTHAGFRFGNSGSIHALDHFVRDADIVHLHYPFYGTAHEVARLRKKGVIKKLVMTLHMDADADGLKGQIFRFLRLFQKPILDSADALIVASKDYAEHASYNDSVEKAYEIPFGVDESFFCPGPSERESWNVPLDVPMTLFVGGMDRAHAFKGVDIFLKALAELPGVHAMLVGDGARRASYEALAREFHIENRCHFVGSLNQERLRSAYRSADVLVLPSISKAEAFGLVVIEAQACGIPVVVSDLPGVRQVIQSGVTGMVVPPRDGAALAQAIRALLADPAQRHAMGDAGRRLVLDRYTWKKHIDQLMDVYTLCASPS